MRIDIFADVICPWCYIGRHRLGKALRQRPHVPVEIHWQPFQLNPDMPAGGMERSLYLAAKFGGVDRARHIYGAIADAARRDHLPLVLHRIRRTPNTLDVHRLIHWAAAYGNQDALVVRVQEAYFQHGADLGDRETLAELAVSVGYAHADITAVLDRDTFAEAVQMADLRARQSGIQAVPFFIFNRRYAMAGAQEPNAFLPLLDLDLIEPSATDLAIASSTL